MKFTDGFWRMRDGYEASYATAPGEVATGRSSLRLYSPTHPIRHRGDTLKGPLLTIDCRSPAEGVIAVSVAHFRDAATSAPAFRLVDGDAGQVTEDTDSIELTSGELSMVIPRRGPFRATFRDRTGVLTGLGTKSVATVTGPHAANFMLVQLDLGVGEHIYGLGERFTPFVKNGQVVESWNADGGTSSEQAYKAIPFYLSDAGYGVLVNHPGHVSYEVGSEAVSRVQFSVEDEALEFWIVHGPSPEDVLERYTSVAGRPALPPPWSFGLWLSTSFTTDYTETTVTDFVRGMAERDLPLSVFHFDCFWMRQWRWCDFEWDPAVSQEPEAMLARLKNEHGLHVSVWINPYVAQQSPLFAEGAARGYLLRRRNGTVWQSDQWQPGMGIVDFTNPAACTWYAAHLRRLLAQGVDTFKTDFGERIPVEDVVWHDRSHSQRMHNGYTLLYNETVFTLLEKERGPGEAVVFARSATVGGQRFPVHWGGDSTSTFASMAETLRGGLSLSLSGFGFWSHDIGGFEGTPEPAVFKRWVAFGLMSSHSRLHGSGSYRVPWLIDVEAVDVLRRFTKLKARLMPYLFAAAVDAHTRGIPVMRPMILAFPHDPACATLDRQYLLGPNILVAPVFNDEGKVTYYVPEGTWISLLTGETVAGARWRTEHHGFDSLPLLIRPDSVTAMGPVETRPDYDYADEPVLVVHALANGATHETAVHTHDGMVSARFSTRRDDDAIEVTSDGRARDWSVLLLGVSGDVRVEGGRANPSSGGVVLTPDASSGTIRARQVT